MWLKENFYFE
jgi:hypothetical protein